jgi:hypothetical protein
MDPVLRYELTNVALTGVALVHALATWPPVDVAALFGGGAALVFVLETVGVGLGFHEHEMAPQVLGVPLVVVGAWPAIVYLTYRVALVALPAGAQAAAAAAVLATAMDALTEADAVAAGVWTYPEHPLSTVRWRGVPLWNFAAWLGVVFLTAMLPTLV